MPRFSANLDMLFTELPFRSRFSAARMAGFTDVDLMFPEDHDLSQAAAELSANALSLRVVSVAGGDRQMGELGLACHPGLETAFDSSVQHGLAMADALSCDLVNVLIGKLQPGVDETIAMQTLIGNLVRACEMARDHNKIVLITPLNLRDHPGYFLSKTDLALRIIDLVAADNLRLMLDLYHRQIMEGDLAQALYACADVLGHIQIANPPLRSRPDQGEINYKFLFELIDEIGFGGFVGCAYEAHGSTRESLGWMASFRTPVPA